MHWKPHKWRGLSVKIYLLLTFLTAFFSLACLWHTLTKNSDRYDWRVLSEGVYLNDPWYQLRIFIIVYNGAISCYPIQRHQSYRDMYCSKYKRPRYHFRLNKASRRTSKSFVLSALWLRSRFNLILIVSHILMFVFRWKQERTGWSGGQDREVFESKHFQTETAKSQPFHSASTPISGQDIFPPTVSDTRRAHAIGEGPGNDRTSDQKLVSKQAIPEKALCRKEWQTRWSESWCSLRKKRRSDKCIS